jgi:LuxR family maltose regulon positive regulatory protein
MILHTKLYIPHSSSESLVERPTVTEMLDKGLKAKLTVLTAPAGYGKTTCLSEWARHCGKQVGWVSLDRYDNDLVQFWSYVVAAVERTQPGFVHAVDSHLSSIKTNDYESFIAALLNGLNTITDELLLIFDDFHVIELSSIHGSIVYMLEHLPAHIHLYIASRFELPLPAARLQAKGQLCKIALQDLQFQLEEGICFFRDCMRLSLSDEDAAVLVQRTEGWVSGLHLAALSLKRSGDPSAFVRNFNGQQRDIAHYLLEELLGQQSEEVSDFLLQTSILSRMNGSLCEALTGLTRGQELLERMERQNLFVIPLDEHSGWYRYHQLFADFLQQQLQRKQPGRWSETHANAAHWFECNGYPEEAVEHFLLGRHFLEAASLLEKFIGDWHLKRTVLKRWLEILPESILAVKPGIQCLYIKILSEAGELERAEARLQMMEEKLTEPDWQPWAGTFLLIAAEIAMYRKDIPRISQYLDMFEQHEPEGIDLQMISGNMLRGISHDTLLTFFNDLHEAEAFFLQWIQVWEKKNNYPFVGYFYIAYSELLYEWNHIEQSELYVERALRQKSMQPYARILVHATITAARIRQAKGDPQGAVQLLEQVKVKIHSPDYPLFAARVDAERVHISIRQNGSEDVAAWLQACGLHDDDRIALNRFREYVHYARALLICGYLKEVEGLLERMYLLVHHEDRLRDKIMVLTLQSLTLHRQDNVPNALMKLEAALFLAQPQGYIRSFVDEGVELANLLAQYLHHRQISSIRRSLPVSLIYVKKLLHRMNAGMEGALVLAPLLTDQEMKILQLVQQGFMNREIAQSIKVTGETVKMHLKNIYRKLEVNSRMQALQRGRELNIL